MPRSVGKPALAFPYQLNLPPDALIDLKVRRRLGRLIPAWDWLNCFTGLRFTVIPQRRPACRGDARRLCLCPYMLQYLADVPTLRSRSIANGGRAQYLSSRSRPARSCAAMQTLVSTEKPLCL